MTENHFPKSSDPAVISRLVDQLSNNDIRWDGTFVGFVPTIVSDGARQLLTIGGAAVPQLVSALEDESRFVAAHVLLTLISAVEHQTGPWNGLAIDLAADGKTHIDAHQRFELARRWRAWQQAKPHPRSLPSE